MAVAVASQTWRPETLQAVPVAAHAAGLICPACDADAVRSVRGSGLHCAACGTIWQPARREFAYADDYPAARGHHDDVVARCKQRTLALWIRRQDLPLDGQRVLEVGFGGGATLAWLQEQGAVVAGQEPVGANRAAAIAQGIPEARVKSVLEDFADARFDLVLYLDSFEHVLDADTHLASLNRLTGSGARALLVLPVADSLSRRMLGSWWPHDVPDHWIFYSTQGLIRLWSRFGWHLSARFRPWKFVSAETIARHWQMKTGMRLPLGPLASRGVWLNFGERGLVFEKR